MENTTLHRHRFSITRATGIKLEAYDFSHLESSFKIIQDENPESKRVLVQFTTANCGKQNLLQRLINCIEEFYGK
jgi:hypothetical protein